MIFAIAPLALSGASAVASAGTSAVKSAVSHLVNSVVGVFDPGKARDAQREARSEMWYQIAVKGSTYAGRHVLGGRTLVYTVKEKGYYEDRWNKLKSSNPYISQSAETLGGVGIPDNPTDAEITQMAQEIDAYENRSLAQPIGPITAALYAPPPAVTTPPAIPVAPPVSYIPPAVTDPTRGAPQTLPLMQVTADAPKSALGFYILIGVAVVALVLLAVKK